jgi:ribosomal protein S18 acetylase RimI-like enzyme
VDAVEGLGNAPDVQGEAPVMPAELVSSGLERPARSAVKSGPARPRDLEIREMTVDEIAAIFHLGERVFTAERWPTLFRTWDEYEVLSAYQSDLETSLVAMRGRELAGFALGSLIEKDRNPWVYGYIKWVAVDPRFAGLGVGGALVRALRAAFIETGARMLLVDTEADNQPARNFFRKLGFAHETEHVYLSLNLTKERDYLRHRQRQQTRVKSVAKRAGSPGSPVPSESSAEDEPSLADGLSSREAPRSRRAGRARKVPPTTG